MFETLATNEDYQKMLEESKQTPQLLLKLSPICPTSFQVQHDMESFVKESDAPKAWAIDVIKSRPLSREIAEWVKVRHESPQAILFKNEKVVWSASHYSISKGAINEAIKRINS